MTYPIANTRPATPVQTVCRAAVLALLLLGAAPALGQEAEDTAPARALVSPSDAPSATSATGTQTGTSANAAGQSRVPVAAPGADMLAEPAAVDSTESPGEPEQRRPVARRTSPRRRSSGARGTSANGAHERATAPTGGSASPSSGPSQSVQAASDVEDRPVTAYSEPSKSARDGADTGHLVSGVVGNLALVVLLAIACGAAWNRLRGLPVRKPLGKTGPTSSRISVTASTALGTQRFLHIVSIDGRRLLVGSSPQSVTLVADLGDATAATEEQPDETAPATRVTVADGPFSALLARLADTMSPAQTHAPEAAPQFVTARSARDAYAVDHQPAPDRSHNRGAHPVAPPARRASDERPADRTPHRAGAASGSLFRTAAPSRRERPNA